MKHYQRDYPNKTVWAFFLLAAIIFGAGVVTYILLGWKANDPYLLPLIEGIGTIFFHGFVAVFFRLFRKSAQKKCMRIFHILLGILSFCAAIYCKIHIFNPNATALHFKHEMIIATITLLMEFFYIISALFMFICCKTISTWKRMVQEGCHALFGIYFLLAYTMDFVMANGSLIRNRILGVVYQQRADNIDISLTVYSLTTITYIMIVTFIVINPHFDWKHNQHLARDEEVDDEQIAK